MSSIRVPQAQMLYPAAQLKWEKEAEGNSTIRNLSTHKKAYFHTENWNISHKHVHLDIFCISRNEFLGWIFMRVATVYCRSNIFVTCYTIWGLMDCSQIAVNSPFPYLPSFASTHRFTSVSLTTISCSPAYGWDRSWDTITNKSVFNSFYATYKKRYVVFFNVCKSEFWYLVACGYYINLGMA